MKRIGIALLLGVAVMVGIVLIFPALAIASKDFLNSLTGRYG